jgi:pimeloyl-ACP methyl ester carboxylesterase
MADIAYRTADVDGLTVFYREAGAAGAPTLVLLHGFPSASHMFRELIPLLADRFHLVAPDLPGFGKSDMPPRGDFDYTFEHITDVIDRLTDVLGLDRFALYVFDYGAPVGFRIATRHPERITAIISQNGNAYEDGLSDGWNPVQAYWKDPSEVNREAIRMFVEPQTTIWQYTHGVPDTTRVSPDGYGLDNYYLARSGAEEIQLDLFLDYASNVALYPAFQEYFRTSRPPLLAVWGRNDPFFLPAGAEAFKRDIPDADVRFVDTGHFALGTHVEEIAAAIGEFLTRLGEAVAGTGRRGERCRRPLFGQEAVPVRSGDQGGADVAGQDHEVIVGQRRAAAGEGRGRRVERGDAHYAVRRHDVVAGGVVGDRPARAHVVVQQFHPWRGQVRPEPGDADVDVVDVVEVGLLGSAVLGASSGAEPEHGPEEPRAAGRVADRDSGVIDAEKGSGAVSPAPFSRDAPLREGEQF